MKVGANMKRKILYCANIDYHFKVFHLPYMKWFQEKGWEVHVAANGHIKLPYCDKKYDVPIHRCPISLKNIVAFKKLKAIIKENNYDIIHVHTPMAGVLVRIAAKSNRRSGMKVIYTAHGFHFFKGAPLKNWLVYYPLEKWLSRYTDYLITINNEDYAEAVKHKFSAGNIEHVHGIGVDCARFRPISEMDINRLRNKYGYKKEQFLLYYAAELNKNKNQGLLLEVLAKLKERIPNIRLLLVGNGPLEKYYKKMASKLCVKDRVDFLGFREDMDSIAQMCDAVAASSIREGLPVNIMEAMACGKPVVATNNRGHRELIEHNSTGFIVNNAFEFAERVYELYMSKELRVLLGTRGIQKISVYSLNNVMNEMEHVYTKAMTRREIDDASYKSTSRSC